MLRVFRVRNDSMRPSLSEGDFVIALRRRRSPTSGELVVIDHPEFGTLIKRVESIRDDGTFRCGSDNPAGLDSRRIGCMAPQTLRGIVWQIVRRPTRG